ncbi:hypothetical protein HQ865_01375 [Mucilaginibacter mali]|uniref:Uncharacterized protein n=1 Tax=Mucilaginibacter mali TaxID=2740462 RepID=A0A7D4PYW2_9SPHI|nr:hypothetical protein [Mucilaginibacter mali]QKJ28466.1 hypothetical protein HQ865_01375 [Mucilaginibacter mali]
MAKNISFAADKTVGVNAGDNSSLSSGTSKTLKSADFEGFLMNNKKSV